MTTKLIKGDKKIINAWAMYDWANSVYSLVITSTIFPVYYNAVTSSGGSDKVHFLGREMVNTALYAYALSAGFLVVVLLSPLLSGIADYSGMKKGFMKAFCYLGASGCASLFFFESDTLYIGIAGLMIATIGYSGSLVFYNAYLPEIAEPADHDRVSAKGFALGYIGSALLLVFNLLMISFPHWFGITDDGFPAKVSFLLVGAWWVFFAQFTFRRLPKNVYNRQAAGNVLFKGYEELAGVWRQLGDMKGLKLFLLSFFVYSMGVQTVMYMAASFGEKEIGMDTGELILTVLIIQFVAIAGAWLFAWLSSRIGNVPALSVSLAVWIVICGGAYFVHTAVQFYVIAAAVGMVMGGVQSLSRSTYSRMLPETVDHASYFSFYEISEKTGIVLGMASYGFIEEQTGSMRNSALALMAYFVVGMALLWSVRSAQAGKVGGC